MKLHSGPLPLLTVGYFLWIYLFLCAVVPSADATNATRAQIDEAIAQLDSLRAARESQLLHETAAPLIARARANTDSVFLMSLLIRDGIEWSSYGYVKEGEPIMREALSLAEALMDSLHMCLCMRWLGYCVGELGRRDEGFDITTRQLKIARAIGSTHHEGWALVAIAWKTYQDGQLDEAARFYRQAVAAFSHNEDTTGTLWARNGLGIVLGDMGAFHEAIRNYEAAVTIARGQGLLIGEALALNNLGTIRFALGDPSLAMVAFQRAYEIHCQIGNLRESLVPGSNIVYCQTQLGRFKEAVTRIREMLAECRKMQNPAKESDLLNQLGHIRQIQGLYHEAIASFEQSQALGDAVTYDTRIETLTGLSHCYADIDSSAIALAVLQDADAEIRAMAGGEHAVLWDLALGRRHNDVGNHPAALKHLRLADDLAAGAGMRDYRISILTGMARAYRALQMPDSTRVCLNEAARVWEAERAISGDPEWREQRGATGRLLYTALAEDLLEHPVDQPLQGRIRTAFDRLQIFKARTLLERMSSPEGNPVLADSSQHDFSITLTELQEHVLQPGELFLDTYLGPDVSICFAVTRDDVNVVRWAADEDLVSKLRYFNELLSTPPVASDASYGAAGRRLAAEKLATELFAGLENMVSRASRIIVAPDGALNLIPLTVLSIGTTGRGDPAQQWIRVPSAKILARLRSRVDRFYDPDNSEDLDRSGAKVLAIAGNDPGRAHALFGAEAEVRRLGRRFKNVEVQVWPAEDHSFSWEDLARYDVLHLASHVQVDDQYPWRSSLLLIPELEAGKRDSSLDAARIASMRLPSDLVVLSSCESGAGRMMSGEGVLGIANAFLSAGASTVLATLWPVDDQATVLLMDRFYQELGDGKTVAAALVGAQQALREDPRTAHPFYWSAFVVIGDGTTKIDLVAEKELLSTASIFSTAFALMIMVGVLSLAARKSDRNRREAAD